MLQGNNVYLIDCIQGMKQLPSNSIDSVVTDPPYELGFMGKGWDSSGIAYNVNVWKEAFRVLKPGGYLLSFGGTRTYHRMACAIEDAGFEIRDQIQWIYSSGFPKSLDVSKAIDKLYGAEREATGEVKTRHGGGVGKSDKIGQLNPDWKETPITVPATDEAKKFAGFGTALKPANEPIVVARKPLAETTVAKNVLKYGTGGINIDASRIATNELTPRNNKVGDNDWKNSSGGYVEPSPLGRWPANIILDNSKEVECLFPITSSGAMKREVPAYEGESNVTFLRGRSGPSNQHGDEGSASRFFYKAEFTEHDFTSFYCSKASKKERGEFNTHPTVKPLKLMEYLVRLVTPPQGICLDPFAGSGTTLLACKLQGFNYIGFDNDPESVEIAKKRLEILGNRTDV